jgi:hypothetical protein
MMSSARWFLSGVISFLVLPKTLSHSAGIAGIASNEKAVFASFHQDIGLKALGSGIAVGAE